MTKAWQVWADEPELLSTLARRAKNELPQMESTKQLVKLLRPAYEPGMTVLDVGCNTGHYLRGLLEIDQKINYTGTDAYPYYINQAKEIFRDIPSARFEVKDVFKPLFPKKPFDISFCCNVFLHLPDFRAPLKNILASTKSLCLIRTLVGGQTTIVRRAIGPELDADGTPKRFAFENTWTPEQISSHAASLGWKAEFIEDEFDPRVISTELAKIKGGDGTGIIAGKQVEGNIIFNWKFIRLTPSHKGARK